MLHSNAEPERRTFRHVILTGFMGTGKTTVGRALAARLGFEAVDSDEVIEARHGPIDRIFAQRGEHEFRRIERELAAELAGRSGLVISTGGRMMLDAANVAALRLASPVVCLVADPDEILRRVTSDGGMDRPLLAVPDKRARIAELLAERTPAYRRFAQVATDHRSPDDIAREVDELASTPPRRTPVGGGSVVVGVALLAFVEELAPVDRPLVVVGDDTGADLAPGAPPGDHVVTVASGTAPAEVIQRSPAIVADAGTVLALGGSALLAAVGSAERSAATGNRLVLVPADVPAVERAVVVAAEAGSAVTVLVDAGILQGAGPGSPRPHGLASLAERLSGRLAELIDPCPGR